MSRLWIVSVQPIPRPGEAPAASNLAFNTQVEAANPLSAIDEARSQLEQVFAASGLSMAEAKKTEAAP